MIGRSKNRQETVARPMVNTSSMGAEIQSGASNTTPNCLDVVEMNELVENVTAVADASQAAQGRGLQKGDEARGLVLRDLEDKKRGCSRDCRRIEASWWKTSE